MKKGGWDSRRIPPRGARGRVSPALESSSSSSYLHYHGIKERVEAWLADVLLVEPDDPLVHLHGLIGAEISARKQLKGSSPIDSSRSASRFSQSSTSRSASSLQRPESVAEGSVEEEPAQSNGEAQGENGLESDENGLGGIPAGEVGIKALITVQGLGPEGGSILFSRRAASESANLQLLAGWCEDIAAVVRNRLLPSAPGDAEAAARVPVAATSAVDKAVAKLKGLWDGTNRMQEVFEWLDTDNSGYIDHVELRSAMQLLGAPVSEEEAKSVLAFLDTNGDDKINYAEFQQALALVPSAGDELQHWLASLNLPGLVAGCLPSAGPDDALKALRELSFPELYATSLNITTALANLMWSALENLRSSAVFPGRSASSLSASLPSNLCNTSSASSSSSSHPTQPAALGAGAKFALGSRHMVTNHSLYRLNQGVENIIGLPHNQVLEAIQAEHCSSADSEDSFIAHDGFSTSPRSEWLFLVAPSECPPQVVDGRHVATVRELLKHPLAAQAGLRAEEVMALRLCTGPMLSKYNASLRGKGCAEFGALRGNAYATTIHAVVSGIAKLARCSKLDKDQKVFVGLEGLLLPESLWKQDANGHRGGVVKGLLSTTTARDMALQHTGLSNPLSKAKPTVFELSMGQIDRGANVQWLSQRPTEEEVLFPPCSHLEVLSEGRSLFTPTGPCLLVPLRIHVNNNTLTWD